MSDIPPDAWMLVFHQDQLLVHDQLSFVRPEMLANFKASSPRFLGHWREKPYFVLDLPEMLTPPSEHQWIRLLQLAGMIEAEAFGIAGRAHHLLHWHRNSRFCGRCGTLMQPQAEHAKHCPGCQQTFFPPISPAVIVLITRGRELLLAEAKFRTGRFFSLIAGFVSPGETLEEAVHREVKEEVGIEVKNLKYFGSQPWPFPQNLMVGFTAEYASGEIEIDPSEIESAAWFAPEALPSALPRPFSIARKMIEKTIADGE